MSTTIQPAQLDQSIIQSLVLNGDLSKMDPQMKVTYYKQFCERIGLDPFTQPFKLLKLNGKEVLYCDRSGTQQLNKKHSISHEIRGREIISDCYVVTAQAIDPTGRHTESIGAVSIIGLKGENLCNAMMKAETKAKRRATLDLLGLGILDETEVDAIPGATTTPLDLNGQSETTTPPARPLAPDTLPAITDAQFFQACTRVGTGDANAYHKTIQYFTLTTGQRKQLDDLMLNSSKKTA
ncbi:hypothetical protein [Chitinophaga sp. HK235]|uniref:hypothetical protein n=1 Tax=Chitinophaga sp. HK235 TaxID=2952571 RepID=UPI001BAB7667|nr:hypothetical protein [Chitinophaga sp. HK235]